MPNTTASEASSVIITAGYERAPQAVALVQLLQRDGLPIAGIVVVRPLNFARARQVLRTGGITALWTSARKAFGRPGKGSEREGPLRRFFRNENLRDDSLRLIARKGNIPYLTVSDLNSSDCLKFIGDAGADGLIYCGGGLIRAPLLAAAPRILNAHAGPLPEVRGMNAAEWSLLTARPQMVTIHYIDQGIDTGPALDVEPYRAVSGDDTTSVRERTIMAAVEGLRRAVLKLRDPLPTRAADAASHRQYFTVARYLRPVLDARLRTVAR